MPSIYCAVSSCWGSRESKHQFPHPNEDKENFTKWVSLCGNRRLVKEMTPDKIFSNCRVCSLHFSSSDFGPNQRLKKGACPSAQLPEPLIDSDFINWPPGFFPCKEFRNEEDPLKHPSISMKSTNNSSSIDYASNMICQDTPGSTTTTTPKMHTGLLCEVGISRARDLSPKARHFYERAKQFKNRAIQSTKSRLSLKTRLALASKVTHSQMFEKVVNSMDRIRSRFFLSQVENLNRKPRGKRYTLEDKVLALALYKQSGVGYRLLSKLFSLPSRKTVMKLLNRVPIKPGLHDEVFSVLKVEAKNFKNPLDKHCVLLFDEMSIQANLNANVSDESVEGFEDFGYKRSDKIANHAQVFMLRGIRRKWKQAIYYNFANGGTKKFDLVHIIKIIIRKCNNVGLNVIATVCDQGANNQAAINALVAETKEKFKRNGKEMYDFHFEIDDTKVIPLFDVPHLFKGLRNMLLKYHLHFIDNGSGKLAKWEHIHTAYKMDPYLGSLRLMPKLTDGHVNPDKINKMKVSKCTQVLSHSVAAAINVFAFSGTTVETEEGFLKLDKSAADTANLLEFLDTLFDSLNGSSFNPTAGKYMRVPVTASSPHTKFWNEAISKLKTFNFIRNGKFFTPPSLKNLIQTIKNFKDLFKEMVSLGFTHMMPRTFNQDPVENFFGQIRQRGHRNINPTSTDFTHYYKSLLVKGITSNHSVGANCEDDNSEIFLTLQRLVSQGLPEEEELPAVDYSAVPENMQHTGHRIENKVLRYVGGYIFKKTGRLSCDCKKSFLKTLSSKRVEDEEFLKFKEFNGNQTHLKYINDNFLNKLKDALAIIKYIFNRDFHKPKVINYLFNILCERISFTPCFHDEKIKTIIFKYFIKVNVFNYCTQLNRIIKGLDQRAIPKNSPNMFLNAREMYVNMSKRKKAMNKNRLVNP